jgi:hypothetical protein
MISAFERAAVVAAVALALVAVAERRAQADSGNSANAVLNVYGNIDYGVSKQDGQPATNSFAIPQFDLLFTGSKDRLVFAAEVLFDVDQGNDITVDIDRLKISYLWRSWLAISAGKFHTAFGYYNTAYPQGAAFYELAVDRPVLVASHDNDSLLPALGIGVRADGRLSLGAAGAFHYDLDVMNGRGVDPNEATNVTDHNNDKSINVRLRYEPAFLDGLIIGGNAYFDQIPASAVQPLDLREQIFGAHVAYVESPWHLILEGYVIRHLTEDGFLFRTLAGLGQLGYSLGDFTPYLRLELVRFPAGGDPFFALGGSASRGSMTDVSAGVKWTISSAFVMKLELEDNEAAVNDIRSVITQAAFAF